jgi:hypothetical protein
MSAARTSHVRWRWIGALVFLASAGTLAGYLGQPYWQQGASARQWRRQLAALPEQQAADFLLAHAGESIDPVRLVEALGGGRPLVTAAARDLLIETLDHWQLEPASHTSPHVAEMAAMLAQRVPQWEPHAQQAASELAVRLLRWPTDRSAMNEEQFVSDCENVLRQQARPRQGEQRPATAEPDGAVASQQLPDACLPGEPYGQWRELDSAPSERQFALPGGDLPIEVADRPPQTSREMRWASSEFSRPDATTRAPTPAPSPTDANQHQPASVPQNSPEQQPPLAWRAPDEARPIDTRATPPRPDHAKSLAAGRFPDLSLSPLNDLQDVQVMHRLHASDPSLVRRARDELSRRGYRAVDIELGRQMTDPSPAVRLRLVEALPEIPHVKALPWLRHLARDEDPDVRLAALGILATSSDPATRKWVRQAVQQEPDVRVSKQLQNLFPR